MTTVMSNLVIGFKAATLEDGLGFLSNLEFLKHKVDHVEGRKIPSTAETQCKCFFPFLGRLEF